MSNDRKRAWKIFSAAMNGRLDPATKTTEGEWRDVIETTVRDADSVATLVANVATFGSTVAFAQNPDKQLLRSSLMGWMTV